MKNFYIHILWWFAFPFIGISNGVLREATYKSIVGDLPAHQISTFTGIIFFGLIFFLIIVFSFREKPPDDKVIQLIELVLPVIASLLGMVFGFYFAKERLSKSNEK